MCGGGGGGGGGLQITKYTIYRKYVIYFVNKTLLTHKPVVVVIFY